MKLFQRIFNKLSNMDIELWGRRTAVCPKETGKMKLSQDRGLPDFSCRGASRSALISGGSRTAPTNGVSKWGILRQFLMPVEPKTGHFWFRAASARCHKALLFLVLPLLVAACSLPNSTPLYQSSRVLMGTFVEVKIPGQGEKPQAAAEAIFDELKRVEDLTSFHKPSGLGRINSAAGTDPVQAEPELLQLIGQGLRVAQETQGAFDPTVGSITRIWQFSGGEPRLPDAAEIAQALKRVGWDKVKLDPAAGMILLSESGMALDLGGIAKGYTLDRASEVIKKLGISSALVNLGGDILAVGQRSPGKPWRVGVQDPRNETGMVAVASLKDRVIVTSGDYQRFFINNGNRYHHILDPQTGYPAPGLQSVTLVAPNGSTAEPLAVAVFVMGVEHGLKYIESVSGVYGFFIDQEGKVHMSAGADSVFEMKKQ